MMDDDFLDFPFEEADDFEGSSDPISFFSEDIDFSLDGQEKFQSWIKEVILFHHGLLGFLNVVFCSDAYLLKLNQEYLQHDTLTDIITFPYQDPPRVEGDIFISIERVRENAQAYGVAFAHELSRVIIHGVLHLCGFGDKTEEEQVLMRAKEEEAMRKLS